MTTSVVPLTIYLAEEIELFCILNANGRCPGEIRKTFSEHHTEWFHFRSLIPNSLPLPVHQSQEQVALSDSGWIFVGSVKVKKQYNNSLLYLELSFNEF